MGGEQSDLTACSCLWRMKNLARAYLHAASLLQACGSSGSGRYSLTDVLSPSCEACWPLRYPEDRVEFEGCGDADVYA